MRRTKHVATAIALVSMLASSTAGFAQFRERENLMQQEQTRLRVRLRLLDQAGTREGM